MRAPISASRRRGARGATSLGGRVLLHLGVALTIGGCATGAEKIIRRTTPATIEESLRSLNDPEVQSMIRRLLDKVEVREAMNELARSISEGMLDGLGDEERAARLEAISERFVQRLSKALGDGLRDEITPKAERLIADSVRAAMDEALSPSNRRRAEEAAAGITRHTIAALVTASSDGLRDDVGPALAHVIDEDVGPALERMIAERLVPAMIRSISAEATPLVGALARETSRNVVLGVDDALVELDVIDPAERGQLVRKLSAGLDRSMKTGEVLAWIFAVLAVILGVWLVRLMLKTRDLQQSKDRSERALAGLLRRLHLRGPHEPWIGEVIAMVEDSLRDAPAQLPREARPEDASSAAPRSGGAPPPSPG
ncbi:MAG: hypothetical protein R3B09_25605 [Nannocystaceae bacterium]